MCVVFIDDSSTTLTDDEILAGAEYRAALVYSAAAILSEYMHSA